MNMVTRTKETKNNPEMLKLEETNLISEVYNVIKSKTVPVVISLNIMS
jgi:hypothetical protein